MHKILKHSHFASDSLGKPFFIFFIFIDNRKHRILVERALILQRNVFCYLGKNMYTCGYFWSFSFISRKRDADLVLRNKRFSFLYFYSVTYKNVFSCPRKKKCAAVLLILCIRLDWNGGFDSCVDAMVCFDLVSLEDMSPS